MREFQRGGPSRRGVLGAAVGVAAAPTALRAAGPPPPAEASGKVDMTLNVNGRPRRATMDVRTSLLDALREHLRPHRLQEGLRPGPVRRLHRARRRQAGAVAA